MGGAFSFAQGDRGPGLPGAAAPFSSCARAHVRLLGGAPAAQAGFPPLPWAALLFLLRSCARGAEDGVCCLLYVAFLDTAELTSSISPFARFLRPLSGFYSGDAVAFSFSFIS